MLASFRARCSIAHNNPWRGSQTHYLKYIVQSSPWIRHASVTRKLVKKGRVKGDAVYQDGRRIVLSLEQQYVLDKVVGEKKSLFFTGSAGTGKSVLLREVIQRLRQNGLRVAVTASTGIAAVNIGGTTLHSFAGIGLGNLPLSELLVRTRASRMAKQRWRETEVLVIDEISMVSAQLLDVVEAVARDLRQSTKPFGGIQVVVSGDFFQLPPVSDTEEFDADEDCKFAFEAKCWDRAFPEAYKLTKIYRQKDSKLIRVLDQMRHGKLTAKSNALLESLSRPLDCSDGILPTEIYPLRRRVERANHERMAQLKSEGRAYTAEDTAGTNTYGYRIQLLEAEKMLETRVPRDLTLRVGAQVMCVQNLPDASLVNGSTGCVIDFLTPETASEAGYPIAGAGIIISEDGVVQRPTIKKAYRGREWPLVRFTNGGEFLMIPTDFTLENTTGELRARRRQVPLILAWALTIHKAQGQTIDRLSVDLGKTFAPGQAYVAVSRCRTLEELQLLNFSPKTVFVNPKVIAWDQNLSVAPIEIETTQAAA